ncbi:MAG TPA: hypothetical protein VMW27_16625 [Thermoanaerobaculia bacterium]|nr:hypothetical protein [Thermoanaerobaculia bacterium]
MIEEREPTEKELRLGSQISAAVEQYARKHSAALILFHAKDHVDVGSATCVTIEGHFFLATAAHNFGGNIPRESIRVVAPHSTSEDWLPIARIGFVDSCHPDVGYLELEPSVAQRSGLEFLSLESLGLFEKPGPNSLYLAEGIPAALTTRKQPTISLTSLGYMTIPAETEAVKHEYSPEMELLLEYTGAQYPLPPPNGMSGGGIWRVPNELQPMVWTPESSKLVAIVRSWWPQSNHLAAVRIEYWLQLMSRHYPDITEEIEALLSGDT